MARHDYWLVEAGRSPRKMPMRVKWQSGRGALASGAAKACEQDFSFRVCSLLDLRHLVARMGCRETWCDWK